MDNLEQLQVGSVCLIDSLVSQVGGCHTTTAMAYAFV